MPEASQLRAIGLKLGAAPEDVIGILSEVGRDTAGAISIGKPGTTSEAGWRPVQNAKALERILEELPSKPFLVGEDGVSMSLAGVQSKLGVAIDAKGEICVPVNGAPSTYILKPDSERLYGGVQNEALCMILARRLGLNAPEVTTGTAGKRSLPARHALRPIRAERTLAAPASGGLLPGARQAAIGQIRIRTRPASRGRRWRRCSP